MSTVEIQPIANSVEMSLFDVYTTSYFLQPTLILEEHEEVEVGDSG
jgi:hypothetical protein